MKTAGANVLNIVNMGHALELQQMVCVQMKHVCPIVLKVSLHMLKST